MAVEGLSPTSFRRLLTRSVVLPPALLAVLALVFLGQVIFLLSAARRVDQTDRVISRVNALLRVIVDGETGLRGLLVTGDPVFLEPYDAEERQIDPTFGELAELVSDNPAQVERLKTLRDSHDDWRAYARNEIRLHRDGGDFLTPVVRREGKRRMDAMRVQVADFIRIEVGLREDREQATRRATWVVAGVSLVLALLFGTALALQTRRQLFRVATSYQGALFAVTVHAESLRMSALRLDGLHEIDRAILAAVPVPEMARATLERLQRVIPVGDSFVVVFGPAEEPARVIARTAGRTATGLALAAAAEGSGPRVVADLAAVAGRSPLQECLYQSGYRSCVVVPLRSESEPFGLLILADPGVAVFDDDHLEIADEIVRQLSIAFQQVRLRENLRRNADELERRVEERTRELQHSLEQVKQLQGLLPICAWCKRVRDDQNYWHQVEHYVTDHSEARFTHGICPDCMKTKMDGFDSNDPISRS